MISLSDIVTGEMLGSGEEWGGGGGGGQISVVLISLSDMVTGEILGRGEEWGGDKCCFDQFVTHGNRGNIGKG